MAIIQMMQDDTDGTIMALGEGETVTFSIDGIGYEIDLTKDNAAQLRASLQEFISAAREVRPTRKRKASLASGMDTKAIRAWALKVGIKVSDRGRVPDRIVQQYLKRDEQAATTEPVVDAADQAQPALTVVPDPFTVPANEGTTDKPARKGRAKSKTDATHTAG
jgi:hypothetical protein